MSRKLFVKNDVNFKIFCVNNINIRYKKYSIWKNSILQYIWSLFFTAKLDCDNPNCLIKNNLLVRQTSIAERFISLICDLPSAQCSVRFREDSGDSKIQDKDCQNRVNCMNKISRQWKLLFAFISLLVLINLIKFSECRVHSKVSDIFIALAILSFLCGSWENYGHRVTDSSVTRKWNSCEKRLLLKLRNCVWTTPANHFTLWALSSDTDTWNMRNITHELTAHIL